MTHEYKIGDKVLVEAEITEIRKNGIIVTNDLAGFHFWAGEKNSRPYTPRQEFEYGEEVEVRDFPDQTWRLAKYIGMAHANKEENPFAANLIINHKIMQSSWFAFCRKLKPRETITIGNTTYDKAEFENAVKDLKPVGGKE